jgi:hypothetical protein
MNGVIGRRLSTAGRGGGASRAYQPLGRSAGRSCRVAACAVLRRSGQPLRRTGRRLHLHARGLRRVRRVPGGLDDVARPTRFRRSAVERFRAGSDVRRAWCRRRGHTLRRHHVAAHVFLRGERGGVQYAARLELGLAIANTLPLVLLIAFGIPAIDESLLVATTMPDAASLGAAALLLLYAYAGFENTAAAAGEFKNRQRDAPFALITVAQRAGSAYRAASPRRSRDLATRADGAPLADAALVVIGATPCSWARAICTRLPAASSGRRFSRACTRDFRRPPGRS